MNIIEHVWSILEAAIRRRKPLPNNEDQLWLALEEEWYRIPVETIRNLYRSVPARLEALRKAKGSHTRY
ncbi:hypothetical protein DL93DRAFT_2068458 [Clavulina sp. PMI_390]|nr:hypothetical protein DL93DRAFT_2068458 [Clavulina sp. PMI_390]